LQQQQPTRVVEEEIDPLDAFMSTEVMPEVHRAAAEEVKLKMEARLQRAKELAEGAVKRVVDADDDDSDIEPEPDAIVMVSGDTCSREGGREEGHRTKRVVRPPVLLRCSAALRYLRCLPIIAVHPSVSGVQCDCPAVFHWVFSRTQSSSWFCPPRPRPPLPRYVDASGFGMGRFPPTR
jgi:hypothetical protein